MSIEAGLDALKAFAARADAPSEQLSPAPGGSVRSDSTQRAKQRREIGREAQESQGTITAGHSMAFTWLRHGEGNFGLLSCFVNGEPSALVAAANSAGERIEIMPLFIALTKGMVVTSPDGDIIWDGSGA